MGKHDSVSITNISGQLLKDNPRCRCFVLVADDRNQDDVAILHLCAFGLDANFSGRLPAIGGGVLEEVVDFDFQLGAVEGDFVLVPLADWFFVGVFHLDCATALGSLWVSFHRELVDVPDVPDVAVLALGFYGARPDFVFTDHTQQYAAIAFGEMSELKSKDIVGVIVCSADVACRFAVVEHCGVFDAPGVTEIWRVEGPALEVFGVEEELCLAEVVREVLDADVPELDGHRRAGVKLQREDAFHCSAGWVVVNHFDCLVAVEDVNEVIASCDDGVLVPVFVFVVTGLYESAPFGNFADEQLVGVLIDEDDVTNIGHPAAPSFMIEEADFAWFVFDLGLVAGDSPFAEVLAAVLDTGVAVVDAELYFEDEVFQFSASPDAEGVSVCGVFPGGLASDGTVLYGPESRVAVPGGEVLTIEDVNEAGLDSRRRFAMFGRLGALAF